MYFNAPAQWNAVLCKLRMSKLHCTSRMDKSCKRECRVKGARNKRPYIVQSITSIVQSITSIIRHVKLTPVVKIKLMAAFGERVLTSVGSDTQVWVLIT